MSSSLFAQINALNQEIVLARKRGEHEKIERLKAEVQVLLQQGVQAQKQRPKATPPPADSSNENPMAARMARLRRLNEEIVQARRRGDDGTVKFLKEQVETLLQDGIEAVRRGETFESSSPPPTPPKPSINPQEGLQKMATIRALNEDLVAARKRGDEATMARLKAELETLLKSAL